jgi:hypothetical protein
LCCVDCETKESLWHVSFVQYIYGLNSQTISRLFSSNALKRKAHLIISFCVICLTGSCQWRPHVCCKHLLDTDCVTVVLPVTGSDNDRRLTNSYWGFYSVLTVRYRHSIW